MKNKHALKFLELKNEVEKVGLNITEVESKHTPNKKGKITYIEFDDDYIRYISFVDGEGYYEKGKETCINVYCGESTKLGVWFKNYQELAKKLKQISITKGYTI